MASYDMNQTMRSLTLVTIIFFPLTLLTGYFVCHIFSPTVSADVYASLGHELPRRLFFHQTF
jgi:hypothetical protein